MGLKSPVIVVSTEFGDFLFDQDLNLLVADQYEPTIIITIHQEALISAEDLEEMRLSFTDEMIEERFHQALVRKSKKIFSQLAQAASEASSMHSTPSKKDH